MVRKDTMISQLEDENSFKSEDSGGNDYDGQKFKRELIKRHIKLSMRNHFKKKLNLTTNHSIKVEDSEIIQELNSYRRGGISSAN